MLRAGALPAPLIILEKSWGQGLAQTDGLENLWLSVSLLPFICYLLSAFGSLAVLAWQSTSFLSLLYVCNNPYLARKCRVVPTMGIAVDTNVLVLNVSVRNWARGAQQSLP